MENNKKKGQNIGQSIALIASIIVGGLIGWFGVEYFEKIGISYMETVLFFVIAWLMLYIQVIMHEAGHLLFGLLSGYKFVSFRVGSAIIYKKQGKLHIGRYSLAGTGGQCLMSPPDMVDGQIPYKSYNLGGSLMNLAMAVVAVVLFLVTKPILFVRVLYVTWAAIGIFSAAINGIPMRLGEIDNDGYNAISLGKNPKALRALWLQLKVNELQTEGMRLKDMPAEWFEKPDVEDMKNNMVAAIEVMRCSRLLDEMKFEEASVAMDEALSGDSGMIGIHKMLLQIEQIFCEILGERREDILNQIQDKQLKNFMNSMKTYTSVARTQYAYALLIEKNEKKAAKWKKQVEKTLKSHPIQGDVELEQELLKCCEEAC